MDKALPPLAEALTFEDRVSIEDVLDAAAAWRRGELPWQAAAAIGALKDWRGEALPSYSRYVAMRVAPPSDERRAALLALLDVLIAAEGYKTTPQGTFSVAEIRANEAGWQYANVQGRAA